MVWFSLASVLHPKAGKAGLNGAAADGAGSASGESGKLLANGNLLQVLVGYKISSERFIRGRGLYNVDAFFGRLGKVALTETIAKTDALASLLVSEPGRKEQGRRQSVLIDLFKPVPRSQVRFREDVKVVIP